MKKLFIELKKNKYKYIFLITIIMMGLLSGIVFSNILISLTINNFFVNDDINYLKEILNYIGINLIYLVLILLFSFSIIGIILNPIILYFKSLIIGFNIGIMISIYSYKGIIFGLLTVFPHQIINLLLYLILSFYGIKISINIFKNFFLRKQVNLSILLTKYFKLFKLFFIILIITGIYELFFNNFFIKVFTFLLK